jgi:DNA polymerase III subunit delta
MARSASKSGIVAGLEYLAHTQKYLAQPVCVVFGDDAYLKSEAMAVLRRQVLAGGDAEFGLTEFNGGVVQWRDVRDALASLSLFGAGRRLVVIEEADRFVSDHRPELEDYAAKSTRNILVLDVKSWPGNTRLAKAVAGTGLAIDCGSPPERSIKSWLVERAKTIHDVRLDPAAADTLMQLLPPEIGILVQEIAKLALLAGDSRVINGKLVLENVGDWRVRGTWDMVDAVADGRAADALAQLDRLITSGEKPQALLPMMASTLRKFATASQMYIDAESRRQRLPLREALKQAGMVPFKLEQAERQLRQIGQKRARQLTSWLLAADLAMKSYNSSDERARGEIERLILRLSTDVNSNASGQTASSGMHARGAART